MRYVFGDFELDTQRYELRQADVTRALEPQGFKVLAYLVEQRDRVVSKSELLERLWPHQYVSEATLTQRLVAVRRALGDDGRRQRYIRTVHGRGYRFVATVVEPSEGVLPEPSVTLEPAALPLPAGDRHGLLIGREAELARLQMCLAQALQGERQIVFLSGEAGIGKTTLVDAFIEQAQANTAVWIGRGQCVEHYGAGEAYLPLLEALGRLGHTPGGEHLVAALRQQAPSWLPHLPALLPAAEYAALPRQTPGLTRERMLRELAEAVESVTATQPLLIVLEDLHWSDVSTVDWLTYVARRRDPAQLLILGTYRPSDAMARKHPVHSVMQELQRQGNGVEMPLPYWSVAEVSAYLSRRSGTWTGSTALVHLLHQRTGGNPFFLVTVVEAMELQHSLAGAGQNMEAVAIPAPESVRQLIEYQLEALSAEDQALLEAASVAGESFATAAVAAGMAQTVDEVETRCDALARKGQFVHPLGLETWPDATVATRYGFVHALYHEVLYERLSPGRRLRLHQHIGLHKERAYAARAHDIAAELAVHFVRGQEPRRGVQYLLAAAQKALHRCAYQEALAHLHIGLDVVQRLPATPERWQDEVTLRTLLGQALIATKGAAAPEVEQAYTQARQLCAHLGDTPLFFPVLIGLRYYYNNRLMLAQLEEVARQFLTLAQRQQTALFLPEGHFALGSVAFWRGDFVEARDHLQQGMSFYEPQQHRDHAALYGQDPGVQCLAYLARVLWFLGYPEQALQRSQQAQSLARELAHPLNFVFALYHATSLHQQSQDAEATCTQAEQLADFAQTHSFTRWVAASQVHRGWARAALGAGEECIAPMRQGMATVLATGAEIFRPSFLTLLADAYGKIGQTTASLRLLEEAEQAIAAHQSRYIEAEICRLKGEVLVQQHEANAPQAEVYLQQALEVARRQHARGLELRAALALGRLWQRQGKGAEARQLVGAVYGWFTEGLATADLRKARAFLEELS